MFFHYAQLQRRWPRSVTRRIGKFRFLVLYMLVISLICSICNLLITSLSSPDRRAHCTFTLLHCCMKLNGHSNWISTCLWRSSSSRRGSLSRSGKIEVIVIQLLLVQGSRRHVSSAWLYLSWYRYLSLLTLVVCCIMANSFAYLQDIRELFSLPEQGFDVSLTQKQLQEEHGQQLDV